jgi:4-amino-4-deoxy-L-arabinose transferase-like glycosyltransferase
MTALVRPRRYRRSVLLLIVSIAALLRVVHLDSLPPALFRDEAEKIYNAYCLATTGHDCTGRFLPLFIRVFGVTTSAIYQYAAVPFVWLFGLGEWAARLPAAVAGTLTVLFVFLATERLLGMRTAIWSAISLALSPWHIVFSRWAQQGIFLPLWFALALYCWALFLRGRTWSLVGCAAFCALAFYTYDVARVFVPLLILVWGIVYWRELRPHIREFLVSACVFILLCLPTLSLILFHTSAAQARFSRISIFQPGASWASVVGTFFHNYVSHYSLSFLLINGDSELRHGVGLGVLTFAEFLGLIIGSFCLIRRKSALSGLLLGWLLLFAVPASLTREGIPHALRAIVGIPGVQIVAGIGMNHIELFARRFWRRGAFLGLLMLQLLSFVPFAQRYFGDYATRSALNWQYGVKQVLQILDPLESYLDRIAFSKIFGAEYLVAVYRPLPVVEFHPEHVRAGKFEWLPWNVSVEQWPPLKTEAVAVVTLPLAPPPPGVAVIPIHAPNSQNVVAVIYLNEHARARIRQHTQPGR